MSITKVCEQTCLCTSHVLLQASVRFCPKLLLVHATPIQAHGFHATVYIENVLLEELSGAMRQHRRPIANHQAVGVELGRCKARIARSLEARMMLQVVMPSWRAMWKEERVCHWVHVLVALRDAINRSVGIPGPHDQVTATGRCTILRIEDDGQLFRRGMFISPQVGIGSSRKAELEDGNLRLGVAKHKGPARTEPLFCGKARRG